MHSLELSPQEIEMAHERVTALLDGLPVVRRPLDEGCRLAREDLFLQVQLDYLSSDRAFAWLVVRTTSWDFGGERTDLHDVLSLALAGLLSASGQASCRLIDEVNPAGIPGTEDEIWARLLVPTQPGPLVDLTRPEPLPRLLAAAWSLEEQMWTVLHSPQDCPCEDGAGKGLQPPEDQWEENVLRALGEDRSPETFSSRRVWPEWQYLHAPRSALTVVFAPPLAGLLRVVDTTEQRWAEQTEEGQFVRAGELGNLVPLPALDRAQEILEQLHDLPDDEDLHLFPLEDRVLASGLNHLVALPADCGRDAFRAGWEQVRSRTRRELAFFGTDQALVWADPTPADRFEEMVGELLERSGRVAWIRQVGATTERDRGRDFVAEWVTATSAEALPPESSPQVRTPVVVQCKAAGRPVDASRVPDIIETVEEHQARGYFLAVSTHLTAPLVDRLTALRQRRRFDVVDWWGRREIELELRDAPDVLGRFADVVRPDPGTE